MNRKNSNIKDATRATQRISKGRENRETNTGTHIASRHL